MPKSARLLAAAAVMALDSAMLAYVVTSVVQIFSIGPKGIGVGLVIGILGFLTFFIVQCIIVYVALFNPDGPRKQA